MRSTFIQRTIAGFLYVPTRGIEGLGVRSYKGASEFRSTFIQTGLEGLGVRSGKGDRGVRSTFLQRD